MYFTFTAKLTVHEMDCLREETVGCIMRGRSGCSVLCGPSEGFLGAKRGLALSGPVKGHSRPVCRAVQTQENTSRFQNKSSNPHSEFTRFDVRIFM